MKEDIKKIPLKIRQMTKKPGFVPLRYRFILITSIMLLLLLSILTAVLGVLQTRTIRERIENQGIGLSRYLADISIEYLLTYNYIALERMANQAVHNPDIIYVAIHDKEGRVAGYSNRPDLQYQTLTDPVSTAAVEAAAPLIKIHRPEPGDSKVMDVSTPVILAESGDRWGTVRVCLSLEPMYEQFRQTLWSILLLGFMALGVGILISNWTAQRVTRPLETLVNASVEAARGNLDQTFSIQTRDEVEILASNFSIMIREVLAQKLQLKDQLEEIKRLQEYAEKILATMGDGLLAIDMDGMVAAINPAARAILDIDFGRDVKGSPVRELIDSNTQVSDYIRDALKNRPGHGQQEIHHLKNNETRNILIRASLLDAAPNTPRQIIFNLSDITILKELEKEVRQTQRLADLGTLAAGMAHEIRNPLSAIKTFVDLLPHKISKPGFMDKFQTTVQREINRLNALIEELLELARQPKYEFKQTDIAELLTHCIELMSADLNQNHIECQSILAPDLPVVMADANQLEKVFINLIQNSAQAMPEGGNLSIRAKAGDASVHIHFKDSGHGFSEELAANIFHPFFTTKAKGTGLGLAITHKVVSEHKGQISAESKEGEGACFSIRLPMFS